MTLGRSRAILPLAGFVALTVGAGTAAASATIVTPRCLERDRAVCVVLTGRAVPVHTEEQIAIAGEKINLWTVRGDDCGADRIQESQHTVPDSADQGTAEFDDEFTFPSAGDYLLCVNSTEFGFEGSINIQATDHPPRPKLSPPQATHYRFREGDALPHASAAPVGTAIIFSLSGGAVVDFKFTRVGSHGRPVAAGGFRVTGHLGINRVTFGGRLSRTHKLAPGVYKLRLTAKNAGGKSKAVPALTLTILR